MRLLSTHLILILSHIWVDIVVVIPSFSYNDKEFNVLHIGHNTSDVQRSRCSVCMRFRVFVPLVYSSVFTTIVTSLDTHCLVLATMRLTRLAVFSLFLPLAFGNLLVNLVKQGTAQFSSILLRLLTYISSH